MIISELSSSFVTIVTELAFFVTSIVTGSSDFLKDHLRKELAFFVTSIVTGSSDFLKDHLRKHLNISGKRENGLVFGSSRRVKIV